MTNYDSIVNKSFAYKPLTAYFDRKDSKARQECQNETPQYVFLMKILLRICFYYIRNIQIQYKLKKKKSFIIRRKSRFKAT